MDCCAEGKQVEQVEPEIIWDQKTITDWHKATFPNATLGSQLEKLSEEINELDTAKDKREKELADVIICSIILFNRFNCKIGFLTVNSFINHLLGTMMSPPEAEAYINKLVNDKMEINSKRTWEEVSPGYYRHIVTSLEVKEDEGHA